MLADSYMGIFLGCVLAVAGAVMIIIWWRYRRR